MSVSAKVFWRYEVESVAEAVWCRVAGRVRRAAKIALNVEGGLSSVASPTFLYLNEGIVWIVGRFGVRFTRCPERSGSGDLPQATDRVCTTSATDWLFKLWCSGTVRAKMSSAVYPYYRRILVMFMSAIPTGI